MCQLARCCCCCTLRTGSLVLGILGLVILSIISIFRRWIFQLIPPSFGWIDRFLEWHRMGGGQAPQVPKRKWGFWRSYSYSLRMEGSSYVYLTHNKCIRIETCSHQFWSQFRFSSVFHIDEARHRALLHVTSCDNYMLDDPRSSQRITSPYSTMVDFRHAGHSFAGRFWNYANDWPGRNFGKSHFRMHNRSGCMYVELDKHYDYNSIWPCFI